MIRKAVESDINAIADTYNELLTYEEKHGSNSNWELGVYPTIKVPQRKIPTGTMYVLEEDEEILVIHTLCIPPQKAGRGYGQQMVDYAKDFARELGCKAIRIDTYAHNEPAKSLYQKNGFRIAGYHESLLEGLIKEELAFLEYKIN